MKVISYYCYIKVLKLKKNVTLYLKEYQYITLLGLTASKTDNNEENL